MSRETMQWLNQMTLVGFTEKRGTAWHYKADEQGAEPNHYPGAIPIEDVRRRLFAWQAVESAGITAEVLTDDGVHIYRDAERKAIIRPAGALSPDDKGGILGLFKSGYRIHQYDEWLLQQVATILDDDLSIGSAGLLRDGGVAWVQVEVPDNIVTPSGVEFRPNLLAATSLDGTLATVYKRTATLVVCDNTMAAGLTEQGQEIRIKHSRYSNAKLTDIRQALEIVHSIADDFMAQVEQLTNVSVNEEAWSKFLDAYVPLTDERGNAKEGRGLTIAENKRAKLQNLWHYDERVAPWAGTAHGVVQCVNTYMHHLQGSATGGARGQANMLRAVSGQTEKADHEALALLNGVLA